MKHLSRLHYLKINLSLSLSLCFLISLFSQNSTLITPVSLSGANLTSVEATRWQHFGSMANAQAISIVQLGTIPSETFAGGSFTFSIPGVAANLQAIGQFSQHSPNGDYVCWANLANGRGYLGVASNSSGKFAYAQVDGQHYMMYLLSNRYNALVKLTVNPNFIPQECLPKIENPNNITVNQDCEIDNDCPAVVSILVLLTPEALNWLGAIPHAARFCA